MSEREWTPKEWLHEAIDRYQMGSPQHAAAAAHIGTLSLLVRGAEAAAEWAQNHVV